MTSDATPQEQWEAFMARMERQWRQDLGREATDEERQVFIDWLTTGRFEQWAARQR